MIDVFFPLPFTGEGMFRLSLVLAKANRVRGLFLSRVLKENWIMEDFVKRTLIVAMAALLCSGPVSAAKTKKVPKDLKPVEMRLQWGSVRYSVDGGKMNSYKTLCPYLERLGDREVSDLIGKSRRRDRGANLLGGVGGGAVVWGLCSLWWGEDKEWNDAEIKWPIVAGAVLGAIGSAIRTSADSKRFDAVQRFNSVVRGEQKLSLGARMDGSVALADLRYRF